MPETTHPVVLMPGDQGDIDRLTTALRRSPIWRRDAADATFAAGVLAELADDAYPESSPVILTTRRARREADQAAADSDAMIAELRSELEHARRARNAWCTDAKDARRRLDVAERDHQEQLKLAAGDVDDRARIIRDLRAELAHVKSLNRSSEAEHERAFARAETAAADAEHLEEQLDEWRRRAKLTEQQRDQWIARTVTAEDTVSRIRGQIVALLADIDELLPAAETPTNTADMPPCPAHGDACPPGCMTADLRCLICNRTRARHHLAEAEDGFRHSFAPKPGRNCQCQKPGRPGIEHRYPWEGDCSPRSVSASTTDTADAAGPRDVGQPRCWRCGRNRATHQLIHDHSFVHPRSPFFMGGGGVDG